VLVNALRVTTEKHPSREARCREQPGGYARPKYPTSHKIRGGSIFRVPDRFEVVSTPRLHGRPLFGESVTLMTIDPVDGSLQHRVAVYVSELEFVRASLPSNILTPGVWSALLLDVGDRVFHTILTMDDSGTPTLHATAVDLHAAIARASRPELLPDLVRPGVRF
jgi:hypothetical protein